MTWTTRGMSGPGRWILPAAIAVVFAVTAGKRVVPSLSGANLEWTLDLAAAAGCGFLIRYGFRTLREKNMIENVPSSPIRSVAMGLSEIKGHAPAQATLSAPLSSAPCHYFRYQVEEERSRGKGGKEWVTVDQGESNVPFHVEDPTGRILVNPAGAELLLKRDYERIEPGAGWFGKRKRYREWRIDPTEFVYTLGTVSKLRDEISEGREHLREKLQQAKRDPETIKRFDLDGSGALDEQEWAGAVAVIKDDLMREEAARPAEEPQSNLVVGKGDLETTFIISDRDERSIAASLGWRALAGILLGGAGALLMIVSILGRFGVMPGGWGFPWEKLFN